MEVSRINSYERKNNIKENTLIGAGIGATGAAYIGYLNGNPINQKGDFSDKFVHNVMTACAEDMDDVKFIDFAKKVNDMGAHPTADDVKFVEGYLSDNAKSLGLLDGVAENLDKKSAKNSINEYIENVKQGYREAFADTTEALGKVFKDGKAPKLGDNASDNLKFFAEIANNQAKEMKSQKAWKYAGVGLFVGGVATWIASKLSDKQ